MELAIEKSSNVGRKKAKPSGLGVELRICGMDYEYGTTCTYCQEEGKTAIVFCPACAAGGDFLCEDCDAEVHHYAKRRNHIRTVISVYDLHGAGQLVISFIRFVVCRKLLVKRCREMFDRFYSPQERMHYYFNVKTGSVQWRKPYCLRNEEVSADARRRTRRSRRE